MGSGKTVLSRCLSRDLAIPVVSLDQFVAVHGGSLTYPSRIARSRLCQALRGYGSKGPVLVEGICLRAVARRLPFKLTMTVYVKRVSGSGLWYDGLDLDDYRSGLRIDAERKGLASDDHRYHATYLPHEKATFMLVREESQDNPVVQKVRGRREGRACR